MKIVLYTLSAVLILGLALYAGTASARIKFEGSGCSKCAARMERVLLKEEGVLKAKVSFEDKTAVVTINESKINLKQVQEKIEQLGYPVKEVSRVSEEKK